MDEQVQLHFLELPKFIQQERDGRIDSNDRMSKWLRFLTNTDDSRWEVMAKQDPIIEKAVKRLRIASLDPQTRMEYEAREKALKDIASIRGDGIREGVEIGKKEGIKEGMKEGLKEGKKEGIKATARNLLKEGMDIQFVTRITGLSKEEIEQISAELK